MSTLSGNATKGEKGKRFQQLKINLCTANKPSEPEQQQHKSSIQRKQHGMTSLGKVPTARRPTNLPSEKSEHSGNDPSVNLVPSGGAGWGNKQNESGSTTPSLVQNTNPPTNVAVNNVPMGGTSQQVPHAQHYPPTAKMPPMSQVGHVAVHHGHSDVKTWAMRTQSADASAPNFLAPQSPLFQHEFPSLSSNSEATTTVTPATATATQKTAANAAADTQYGPGPSLRPQTEGSWIQGGSRPQGSTVPAAGNASSTAPVPDRPAGPYPVPLGPDGVRNNLGPSGVGVVQGGPYPPPQHMMPPQFNGMMPAFMFRGPYPPGGFPPNFQPSVKGGGPRPPYGGPYMPSAPPAPGERFGPQPGANSAKRSYDDEDVKIGPIVKEEDLHQMAEMGNDIGWAGHTTMDYSKKLHFSDDEDDGKGKQDKSRSKTQASTKGNEKGAEKKGNEKENDLRNSKEGSKEREKLFVSDARPAEVKNAWHVRRPLMQTTATPTARYQIPAGRFEEEDEAWQEQRRQKKEEMEKIIQRAKERKEEEEKRFIEQQNAAALKLKKLEEKILAQAENGESFDSQSLTNLDDETRTNQNVAPIPVVKDGSEFRELTQLTDRGTFVKETKERENNSQSFSRSHQPSNVAPRFQNLNRQNSSGGQPSSVSRGNSAQQSQFLSKQNTIGGFGSSRHGRLDSESKSEKDRDWTQDEAKKDRDGDRYAKETLGERDYGYDRDDDRKYENRFAKEYESKRRCYGDKDEYGGESYGRGYEREMKSDRKSSESEREKSKNYDHHRYADDGLDKDGRWRSYDTTSEKSRFATSPRVSRTFSESENNERKRSREEAYENQKTNNAEREREYYRKDGKSVNETERESEKSRDDEGKRTRDFESTKGQDGEKANVYEERLGRGNELRENRYHRESRESLRDEYLMQDGRSYSWAEDAEIEEKPKPQRRDHYRDERGGDRYSHQRHPPGPITRAKLEAKELESESKRNLTPLIRSDKKVELRELRKVENDDVKGKDKSEKSSNADAKATDNSTALQSSSKSESHAGENQPVWKKDEKKDETSKSHEQDHDGKDGQKDKDEKKDASGKSASSSASKVAGDDCDKNAALEDKRNDRRKSNNNERRSKAPVDSHWTRYSMYHSNAYDSGRGSDSKSRRLTRGSTLKITPRRDSKYSESDYSDEISETGRDDRGGGSRGDRDKARSTKSSTSTKRYDRDDRSRNNYRMDDRDYMGGGGGNRSRTARDTYYYSTKQPQRGRAGFRNSVTVNKRMDGYGPPPQSSSAMSKNGLEGGRSYGSEDKRTKPSSSSSNKEMTSDTKKTESGGLSKSNSKSNMVDRSWKKNYENAQPETKSAVLSPTSAQTAEANEESFATASEGTDSEETMAQMQKNKSSNYASTKRPTVVVAKPQRKLRSTSRKRYEPRRAAPAYPRKDSLSYAGSSKSTSMGAATAMKTTIGGKENEKMNMEAVDRVVKDDGGKSTGEKSLKEHADSQSRKNVKPPRNRSNPRRTSTVMTAASNGRGSVGGGKSNQDSSSSLRGAQSSKPSKSVDGKFGGGTVDGKDAKASSDITVPHLREVGGPIPAPPPAGNAWDKPLTGTLRNGSVSTVKANVVAASSASMSTTNTTTTVIVQEKSIVQITEQHSESSPMTSEMSASSTLSAEKVTTKVLENLDGATPPVQTIIFENTNFKSGPNDLGGKSKYAATQLKSHRFDKDSKLDGMDASVAFGNDSSAELTASNKHDSLQMALFNKNEDLDFTFDSEFSKLTEDKTAKAMELTHAMHIVQASTDADLNFKIASVKKVWDERLTEHFDDKYDAGGLVNTSASFSPSSFSSHNTDPSNGSCYGNSHVDASGHVQVDDVSLGHGEVVFNPQIQASAYGSNCQAVVIKTDSTASSNVCKVKPQPQGVTMANVAQSSVISTTMVSQPPPLSSPSFNAFSCSTPQPNLNSNAIAATALAQMNFQQYSSLPNMPPPVPSSPVLFNSSQTPAPAPPGVYQTFQIDNSQVASRAPYGQFPSYGLSAGAGIGQTSAFNHQQSLFVTPPTNAPPPEIYAPQIPPFRIQPQSFGNSSQITNHNTVLISSSSNSLMSATIKPSNQQISAIGTKAGYQTTQNSPVFLSLDPNAPIQSQNLLLGGQFIQRPASNVVPAPSLPASTSYYSSASGAGQTGFFPPGSNSALPQPGTQAIGLTAAAFNAQSASTPAGLQNFNAQQLTQQYRSATQPSHLSKSGNTSNIVSDYVFNKTIAIPSQHDVMSTCFQPVGSQMTSSKQRLQSGGAKNVPTVQQAMGQHSIQQNAYGYQPPNQMRNNSGGGGGGVNKGSQYPHPIQRPVSQGNSSNRSGGGNNANNSSSSSHRMSTRNNSHLVNNIQQPPSSVYYSASSGYSTSAPKLETPQLDTKTDSTADSKLADSIKTINVKNNATTTEKTVSSNE